MGPTASCSRSTCTFSLGLSAKALRGSDIARGFFRSITEPSYVVRRRCAGPTTSKRQPPASNASLSEISGRLNMKSTRPF